MQTPVLSYETIQQEIQRRANQRAIQKKRLRLVWVNPKPKEQKACENE